MNVEGLLERLVLDRLLLAGLELVVWIAAPLLIVLVLAGLGAWTVRQADGMLGLVWAATSGAVIVIGAVAALNLFVPIPRWSPVAVIALGTVGLLRSARRLVLTPGVLARAGAVVGLTTGAYRIGYSPPTYDAFLYHGVIVEWLEREAVPQGFGLLHSRFAFNPGLALLMPAVRSGGGDWTHHVLVELAVVALALLVLVALLSAARSRDDGPLAALLGGLVAVSVLFLLLRQRGPGTDLAVAFTLVTAAGLAAAFQRRRAPDPTGSALFALLGMTAALAILQKASAAAVVLLLLAPLLGRRDAAGDRALLRFRVVLPSLVVALVAGIAHTVRTFVMSGCLAYPVAFTCVDATWAIGAEAAANESGVIRSWARDGSVRFPELLDAGWFADWVVRYVRNGAFVVLMLGLLVGAAGLAWRAFGRPTRNPAAHGAVPRRRDGLLWAYALVSASIWFASVPAPRFGIHVHLVLAALLASPTVAMLLRVVDGSQWPVRADALRGRLVGAAVTLVVVVLGAGLVAQGRQFPVSGTVPHAMQDASLPLVDAAGREIGRWPYVFSVGSDQCGDAFPCAPSERNLTVQVGPGGRLRFERPTSLP